VTAPPRALVVGVLSAMDSSSSAVAPRSSRGR